MERTYKTEFPEFDAAELPSIPATWEDISWKNDAAPSWQTPNGFRVYVDRLNPADREDEAWSRYSLHHDEKDYHCDAEDWNEVLAIVLAYEFCRLVRESFTAAQLEEINRRNKTEGYQNGACATAEFSDSNMIMAQAFEAIAGHEVDGDNEEDCALWNAAWDRARAADFRL